MSLQRVGWHVLLGGSVIAADLALILPFGLAAIPMLLAGAPRRWNAVSYWVLAGLLLWATGIVLAAKSAFPVGLVLGHVVAPVSACLVLQGARRFIGRSASGWVPVIGTAGGFATGVAYFGAGRELAIGVAIVASVPLLAMAGLLVFRNAWQTRASIAEHALGISVACLAPTMPADIILRARLEETTQLVPVWGTIVFAIAFLTLTSLTDRAARRARRLTEEREILRRVALTLADTRDPRRAVGRLGDELRDSGLLCFVGIWALDPDGAVLERIEPDEQRTASPETLAQFPSDHPVVRDLLRRRNPVRIDEILRDPRWSNDPAWADTGPGFATPLRSAGRWLGVLVVTFPRNVSLGRSARQFVSDLADEIALVLSNAELTRTDRSRTRELDVERRTLRALIESSPIGVLLSDRGGRIRFMNGPLSDTLGVAPPHKWLGRSAAELGRELADRIDPECRARLAAFISGDSDPELVGSDFNLRGPEDRVLHIASRAVRGEEDRLLGRVWLIRDVTEERRLSERIELAQRMETVGTLAGGLAHDINNQLTAILANVGALLGDLPAREQSWDLAREIERSAEHCAGLTRGLLTFSQQRPLFVEAVAVGPVIEETVALHRPTLPASVSLETEVAADAGFAQADAVELRRILSNLVVNARDAVGDAGRIRVRAERATSETGDALVEISVADDGVGMDEATRRRIFDPFFTTKDRGQGTGLGLAVVYGIAEAHRARIDVESAPGQGARFRLRWPAADAPSAIASSETEARSAAGRDQVTLLLAEDEPQVRRATRRLLEQEGYQVLEAADGNSALAAFAAHASEIALAIVDFSMPGLNGVALRREIRRLKPGLPFLLVSGHAGELDSVAPDDAELLSKPFGPETLLRRVRLALGDTD